MGSTSDRPAATSPTAAAAALPPQQPGPLIPEPQASRRPQQHRWPIDAVRQRRPTTTVTHRCCCPAGARQQRWPIDAARTASMAHRCCSTRPPDRNDGPAMRLTPLPPPGPRSRQPRNHLQALQSHQPRTRPLEEDPRHQDQIKLSGIVRQRHPWAIVAVARPRRSSIHGPRGLLQWSGTKARPRGTHPDPAIGRPSWSSGPARWSRIDDRSGVRIYFGSVNTSLSQWSR